MVRPRSSRKEGVGGSSAAGDDPSGRVGQVDPSDQFDHDGGGKPPRVRVCIGGVFRRFRGVGFMVVGFKVVGFKVVDFVDE